MTERISFSLSIRELDRSDREDVSGVLLKKLLEANILDKRGDRVSFSHEMFLNVFAAETVIRRAGDNPNTVVAALKSPQHLEWLNRDDISEAERTQSCTRSLAILAGYQSGAVAGVVAQFFRSSYMFSESAKGLPGSSPAIMSFDQHFPNEMAAIYRSALRQPAIQSGYLEFFRVEHLIESALGCSGRFGDPSDVPLLRVWSLHPDFASSAVRAIKMIEQIASV